MATQQSNWWIKVHAIQKKCWTACCLTAALKMNSYHLIQLYLFIAEILFMRSKWCIVQKKIDRFFFHFLVVLQQTFSGTPPPFKMFTQTAQTQRMSQLLFTKEEEVNTWWSVLICYKIFGSWFWGDNKNTFDQTKLLCEKNKFASPLLCCYFHLVFH